MLEDGQVPTKPFECVIADLFTIGGKEYLAYIDRLSGWPVVHAFNKAGITTADVTKPIRKTFMDHGIPKSSKATMAHNSHPLDFNLS